MGRPHLSHVNRRPSPQLTPGSPDDETPELTGHDATMDEAEMGDAGSGASPYGADLTGGFPQGVEDAPDQPSDIVPDQVQKWPGGEGEEAEVTAQSRDEIPFDPSDFP